MRFPISFTLRRPVRHVSSVRWVQVGRAVGSVGPLLLGLATPFMSMPAYAQTQAVQTTAHPALPGLVDGNGAPYDQWGADKGWRLMYFGFTNCPDICPTSLFEMTAALDLVPEEQRNLVVPVFATVDPVRDTASVMSRYVSPLSYKFVTLTGPVDTMDRLAWTYQIIAVRAATDSGQPYSVDHSSVVLLVDPNGAVVERFPYTMTYQEVARRLEAHLKGAPLPPA